MTPPSDDFDDDGWGDWPDDDDVVDAEVDDDVSPDPLERGLETLQAAARELIRAARTVLDLAEDVVDDPDAVGNLFAGFAAFARGAARGTWEAPHRDDPDDDPDDIEHIPVD